MGGAGRLSGTLATGGSRETGANLGVVRWSSGSGGAGGQKVGHPAPRDSALGTAPGSRRPVAAETRKPPARLVLSVGLAPIFSSSRGEDKSYVLVMLALSF